MASALHRIAEELKQIASEDDETLRDTDALRFVLRMAARKVESQAEMQEQGLAE